MTILLISSAHAVNTVTNSTYINDFLRDSTGNPNVTGDYTSAFTNFSIQPPRNETWTIERLLVFMEDTAISRLDYYGGGGSALTNGIAFFIEKNGTQVPLSPEAIKTNGDWGRYNYDAEIKDEAAGLDYFYARWTFARSGAPLRLVGENNDKLFMVARDNFNFLSEHTFAIQGQKIPDLVEGDEMIATTLMIIGAVLFVFCLFYSISAQFAFVKNLGFWLSGLFMLAGINYILETASSTVYAPLELIYTGFFWFLTVYGLFMIILYFKDILMSAKEAFKYLKGKMRG